MLHIITGDGKGKTSAAVGMAIRMCGNSGRVLFAQFLKGSDSGEINILRTAAGITVMRLSRDYGFFKFMSMEDISAVRNEHNTILQAALSGDFELIVLDESIPAMNNGLLDTGLLFRVLEKDCEIVMTGRDPDSSLTEKADYISEIKKIRHPFDKGIDARRGVEF